MRPYVMDTRLKPRLGRTRKPRAPDRGGKVGQADDDVTIARDAVDPVTTKTGQERSFAGWQRANSH